MTKRQESLHDEIIRISDVFQLGLSTGDQDWFYKFIIRMDEKKIWNDPRFYQLDFLSKNFIEEFKAGYYFTKYNPILSIVLYGFDGSLKHLTARYVDNEFIQFILEIKDILKDEWIEKNIELFDDSCNPSCQWTYYNRNGKFSPWHYVFESKSVSQELKDKYKARPTKIKKIDDEHDTEKK